MNEDTFNNWGKWKESIYNQANLDSSFKVEVIALGELRDRMTYPNFSPQRIQAQQDFLGKSLEVAAGAGLLQEELSQSELNDITDFFLENADEVAYHLQKVKTSSGTELGPVFLSWTVKAPRSRAAMLTIIKSLDANGISYFDYSENKIDQLGDQERVIKESIQNALDQCNISIELVSAEVGGQWIDFERHIIKNSPRIFRYRIYLESGPPPVIPEDQKNRMVAFYMNDGRTTLSRGGDVCWMDQAHDASYFKGAQFREQADFLAKDILLRLNPPSCLIPLLLSLICVLLIGGVLLGTSLYFFQS